MDEPIVEGPIVDGTGPSSIVEESLPAHEGMNGTVDVKDVIWWQVYPLGFTGAPIRPDTDAQRAPAHRLRRLIPWLDHMTDMGFTGLLLGPIFSSTSHGYDTVDHFSIDSRLGDDDDFDALVRSCHAHGIRLMLDGVFNHVGSRHPLFLRALERCREGNGSGDGLFRMRRRDDGGVDYPMFEGHADLPELDHDSPAVASLVHDVMEHWMRRGADAWRLDAAYAVAPAFWSRVIPPVREDFPDSWFLGEVIHGDYAGIVDVSGMDSVTQYEMWKAVWSSLESANFYELDWCLKRHDAFLGSFVPQTFIGNHDVTRIASRVGERMAELAAVVLFTVGGVPSVYYGDEYAMTGVKEDRFGGDDAIRPAFPDDSASMGASPDSERMLGLYRALVRMRRDRPWLTRAVTAPVSVDNRRYAYDSLESEEHLSAGSVSRRSLRVELGLDPAPWARIGEAGHTILAIGPQG